MTIKKQVYISASVGGEIVSAEVIEDFAGACSRFTIVGTEGCSLNATAAISMGYAGDGDAGAVIAGGLVDSVTAERPPGLYRIEGRDILKKAVDYLIVVASMNPDDFFNPRTQYGHTSPIAIVGDILAKAGITDYSGSGGGGWTLGTEQEGTPFQLVMAWDAIQQVCSLGAWHVWATPSGAVRFACVTPTPSGGASHTLKAGDPAGGANLVSIAYGNSDEDIRNRVVAMGMPGCAAEASAPSPYLPTGYYKTAVVSSDLLGSSEMCQLSANANLSMLNRLTQKATFEGEGKHSVHIHDTVTVEESFCGAAGDWFVYQVTHTIDDAGYRISGILTR